MTHPTTPVSYKRSGIFHYNSPRHADATKLHGKKAFSGVGHGVLPGPVQVLRHVVDELDGGSRKKQTGGGGSNKETETADKSLI